jgi:hypothetical protein
VGGARGLPAPCCADGDTGTGVQVRCIAAVLLLVGRGLEAPGVVARLLDTAGQPGKPQYCLAPEVGRAVHAIVSVLGRRTRKSFRVHGWPAWRMASMQALLEATQCWLE